MDASQAKAARPLDDVMIAMDVVDTLRHDRRILERELNDERRRAELIERLRNLYKGQGIEVPDSILEEGVRALEERRFVYENSGRVCVGSVGPALCHAGQVGPAGAGGAWGHSCAMVCLVCGL